ncbi:hypothetical protein EVAR_12261_1 [Eumeta japonica]|uniref:Uncharacterized protein n=1 Tax=Eumeta variegata TaxID=151549 RepID=A0A4C1TU53_EUMVA|nr:hypothetical protein EVAR_12261_1 [Eumeta japonica]
MDERSKEGGKNMLDVEPFACETAGIEIIVKNDQGRDENRQRYRNWSREQNRAHPQEIADSHIHQGARSVKTTNTTTFKRAAIMQWSKSDENILNPRSLSFVESTTRIRKKCHKFRVRGRTYFSSRVISVDPLPPRQTVVLFVWEACEHQTSDHGSSHRRSYYYQIIVMKKIHQRVRRKTTSRLIPLMNQLG